MNIAKKLYLPAVNMHGWVLAARPKTLIAGLAPVLLGSSLAIKYGTFNLSVFFLCLLFGMSVQIGCNYFNDYFDFVKGVDTKDRVGPQRATASGLISPRAMQVGSCLVLLFSLVVGSALSFYGGWEVILWTLFAIVCAFAYTGGPYPLGYHGYGSIFVLMFFGFVATMYTFSLQSGFFSMDSIWIGLGVGLLAVNLREINDLRDLEQDKKAGKKTLAVRFGKSAIEVLYLFNLVVAYSVPVVLLCTGSHFSPVILLPVLSVPIAYLNTVKLFKAKEKSNYSAIFLNTVKILSAYSVLLAVAICFS